MPTFLPVSKSQETKGLIKFTAVLRRLENRHRSLSPWMTWPLAGISKASPHLLFRITLQHMSAAPCFTWEKGVPGRLSSPREVPLPVIPQPLRVQCPLAGSSRTGPRLAVPWFCSFSPDPTPPNSSLTLCGRSAAFRSWCWWRSAQPRGSQNAQSRSRGSRAHHTPPAPQGNRTQSIQQEVPVEKNGNRDKWLISECWLPACQDNPVSCNSPILQMGDESSERSIYLLTITQ